MQQYAQRRAAEVKNYRRVAKESGIGEDAYEWLCKFARGAIKKSSSDRIETLWRYYKLHETRLRRT
jgi:hypothetical protein